MRIDPHGRAWLEAEARLQLSAERDLEAGLYSADDFIRYDLNDSLLDYLARAFDVLEIIACRCPKLRRRRSGRVFVFVYESVASAGSKHSDGRWWSLGWGVGGCRRPLFE